MSRKRWPQNTQLTYTALATFNWSRVQFVESLRCKSKTERLEVSKSLFASGSTGLFNVVDFEDVESHSLGNGSVFVFKHRERSEFLFKNVPVFKKYLFCPMTTWSPFFTLKQGDTWAGMFLCLFSYLLYLGM